MSFFKLPGDDQVPAMGCKIVFAFNDMYVANEKMGLHPTLGGKILSGSVAFRDIDFADEKGMALTVEIDGVCAIAIAGHIIHEAYKLYADGV